MQFNIVQVHGGMLGHIPDSQNTLAYARISEVVIKGVPNNNCISEGSTPSDEGTGKAWFGWTGKIHVNQETLWENHVLNQWQFTRH